MRKVVYLLWGSLLGICFSCKKTDAVIDKSWNESQYFQESLKGIKNAIGKESFEKDTVFYLESAAYLPCEEEFWAYVRNSPESVPVLLQIGNRRLTVRQVVPDYVKELNTIFPIYSNSISRLIDEMGRTGNGVFLIVMDEGTIVDIDLFME